MVEELGLQEQEARQFLDIYGVYIVQMHDLTRERKKLSKKLRHMAALGNDVPGDRIRETIHELNRIDEAMLNEKNKNMSKMEMFLKPPQMAKYVLFEMRFDDKLRETLMFIRRQRHNGPPPFDFFDPIESE